MKKQNFDEVERELEKRLGGRERRRRGRMKVSSASLKELQRIIIAK